MAISDSLSGASGQLDKLIKQLSQIDDLTESITSKTKGLGTSIMGSVGTAGSVMPSSASFATPAGGQPATGGAPTTANGMPVASFGGAAASSGGGFMSKLGGAALGLGSLMLGAGKLAWDLAPSTQEAYLNQNMLFQTGFMSTGTVDNKATAGRIRAAFGATMTGNLDAQAAAMVLAGRGMGVYSSSFGQVAGEAGFMSKLTGMSNVQTAAGSSSMQFGGANVTGKLMQYGIFTNNLRTGEYGGMGKVIDQLWARWYGSPSAKVPEAVFEADLMGGFLGRDLNYFFGNDQQLYQMVVAGLRLKAKSGGMAGIDFSETARGPRSANVLAKKVGMNDFQNPSQVQMKTNATSYDLLQASTKPLIEGFQAAHTELQKMNVELTKAAESEFGQNLLRAKGFMETFLANEQGLAAFKTALDLATAALGVFAGSQVLRTLANVVKPTKPPTPGVPVRGVPAPGAKPPVGLLRGTFNAAKSFGGRIGVIGGVLTAAEAGYNYKQAYDAEGWSGVLKYAAQISPPGLLWGMMPNNDSGWLNKGRRAMEASDGSLLSLLDAMFTQGNAARYHSEDAPVKRAGGGLGTSTSDSINARLSKGEYVINARAAQKIGLKNLDRMNSLGRDFGNGFASPAKAFNQGGDALGRSASEAAEWAISSTKGDAKFPGLCDRYVANVYGQDHSGYKNAITHWNSTPESMRHPGDRRPPVGALVFWDSSVGGGHGHTAVVTGYNDKGVPLVSTTHLNGGRPTIVSLDTVMPNAYLGWASPYFQGRTSSLGSATGVTQASPESGSAPGESTSSPMQASGYSGSMSMASLYRSLLSNPMSTYMKQVADPVTVFGGGGVSASSAVGATEESSSTSSSASSNEASAQVTGTVNEKKFAVAVLQRLGAPTTKSNVQAMLKWMKAEGGHWKNSAKFNPLNTTLKMPGSRSAGTSQSSIKAYSDWQSGIEATAKTLLDSNPAYGYGAIIDAFRQGSNPQAIYDAIVASSWGTKRNLPGYAHGTDYVARGGTAQVHQGEMIIPASQATDFREALREALSGTGRGTTLNVNLTIEKASDEEADRFVKRVVEKLRYEEKQGRLRNR